MGHAVKQLFKLLMAIKFSKLQFLSMFMWVLSQKTLLYSGFDGKEIATKTNV